MTLGLTRSSSFDDVAKAIVLETKRRGYSRDESIAVLSTAIQESGLRPDATSPNGKWVGIYQQDTSYPRRGDPNANILEFLNRLDTKRADVIGASTSIWLNIFWLQQRPGEKTADAAYRNGRQAYMTEIRSHTAQAGELYDRFVGGTPVADPNRPDFNEYPVWSDNSQDRGGTKIDLFLLHTNEGDNNADSLARWMQGDVGVSYHYAISEDYNDHGVTVCDVVDTDEASWSVLSANNRSINLCFAGSRAGWSREQWMKQKRAIDVAAYLAVQDCKKYGIPRTVIGTGGTYSSARAGVADHQYVTKVLKDGTHTDVGPGFPLDYFRDRFNFYAITAPAPAPDGPQPVGPADDQLTLRWNCLGGQTLVEAVAELRDKITGSRDRGKTGAL